MATPFLTDTMTTFTLPPGPVHGFRLEESMGWTTDEHGNKVGFGPDAWYPGRDKTEAHWARIRADLAAGREIPSRPIRTLQEQADERIAALRQEIEEWEDIKRGVTP